MEDEKKLVELIENRLKKEDYAIDVAYDGLDGYYKASTNIYDLIILDVMLPYKNGFIIAKELLNILVDNAIKHSLENSNISINLYKEKNNIILSVKNRGKEIPIDEREKIFERFYRTDESRNRDENRYGLGLSIAKNIVENHKGIIKVECEDGYTSFITKFK